MSEHQPTGRWVNPTGFVASGVLVVLPFVVALIQWRGGWMPISDWASVVLRAHDTLSAHPTLVGIYSSATGSESGAQVVYHPGPLQEWLLAIPIHLFAPSTFGILFGSAMLVSASILVALTTAWRLGRRETLWMGIIGSSLFLFGTGPMMLAQPLHAWVATFAMVAFLACSWGVLAGHRWFWPGAVFFGSLAGQAQVTFMVPVGVVVAVAAAHELRTWLAVRGQVPDVPSGEQRNARVWIVTAIVTIACWIAPMFDQFFRTGNLWALFTVGRESTPVGLIWALRQLAQTLAIPPSWIDVDQRLSISITDDAQVIWHTSPVEWVTATLIVALLAVGILRASRSGNRVRLALGVTAAASLVGCLVASAMMPDEPLSLLGHREIWRSAGLFTWWFIILVAKDAVVASMPMLRERVERLVPPIATTAVVAGVIAISLSTIVRADPAREVGAMMFGSVAVFTDAAVPWCDRGTVTVEPAELADTSTALGLASMLRLHGCDVHVANLENILPGPVYRVDGSEVATLRVDGSPVPPAGCRRLAGFNPAKPPARYRDFSTAPVGPTRSATEFLFVCATNASATD